MLNKILVLSIILLNPLRIYATDIYQDIQNVLDTESSKHLSECRCLPGLIRKKPHLDKSLRGTIDQIAPEFIINLKNKAYTPTILFQGSGKLLNELTILASIMSKGVSIRAILVDKQYPQKLKKSLQVFNHALQALALKYNVKASTQVYQDIDQALNKAHIDKLTIDAYFMLDLFHGPNRCFNFFIDSLGIHNVYSKSLFFILCKLDHSKNHHSILKVFLGTFHDGRVQNIDLLFQENHQ